MRRAAYSLSAASIFSAGLLLAAQASPAGESAGLSRRLDSLFPAAADKASLSKRLARKDYAAVSAMVGANPAIAQGQRESLLGSLAFLAGDMAQATTYFAQASRLATLPEEDAFTWAMASIKRGDTATARSLLLKLEADHPARALYPYWLGKVDYDLRRYDAAIASLQHATVLDPSSARAWNALGLAFDMAGQTGQASEPLQKAVLLNRKSEHPSPWPPHDLGSLYLRNEQWKLAEACLVEALGYDNSMPQAHYHLGRALEKMDRSMEAIDEYRLAIAEDVTSTDACYSLAALYRRLGRDADAAATLSVYRERKAKVAAASR